MNNSTKTEDEIRESINVLARLQSAKLFTTVDMKDLSNECIRIQSLYDKRQKKIVDKTVEITRTYLPCIEIAIKIFSELDVILSLSHVAANSPNKYVCPKILPMGSGVLRMKSARHPCLELQDDIGNFNYNDNDNNTNNHDSSILQECIPNDVELIKDESSFQIVTGPNMGGKSTYIRMIGMIVLMAQIGSYVPCKSATITIVDSILARVGAGDHQMKGVSTFMAEMLETSTILNGSTKNSLVIIDELGRGTSTYDGFGIAYSISEYLVKEKQSFCLFASHFHELTSLERETGVKNKHVEAYKDEKTNLLRMCYRVVDGPIRRSYGIEVARLAKFPEIVIQSANDKAKELETFEDSKSYDFTTYSFMADILKRYKEIQQKKNENKFSNDQEFDQAVRNLKKQIENECDNNPKVLAMCNQMAKKIKPPNHPKSSRTQPPIGQMY